MSNARKLADLLDSAGDVKLAHLDNVTPTTSASDLTSGTLPIARIANDAIDSIHYAADSIDAEHYAAGSVDATALGADCVTAAKIGDNVINSEHYAAGSIDNEHIADDAINSEHYAADSIDTEHYAAGSVDTTALGADAVTSAKIADDVALGGNPTTTTQSGSDNSTKIATTAYTDAQVATVVDSAPSTLNTLNELAAALGDDANFSTTTATNIAAKLPLAGGAMTGAITTNSTFDGRDVATDGTKLDGIEASADVTDATNVTAAGALMDSEVTNLAEVKAFDASDYATAAQGTTADAALPKAGGTMTGNLALGDDDLLRLGDSNDLQMYHDGSHSYIDEQGTGDLYIRSNSIILGKYTGETMVQGNADGSVDLYHNNSKKFETTAAGATVTGTLTATLQANAIDSDHYVDGSIDAAHLSSSLGDLGAKGITDIGHNAGDKITFTDNTDMRFTVNANEEMRLEADGDLHVDGDVIAFSTTISDATLKYNINPVEFALDKIKQLKGVTFNYLKGNKASAGLLAQDVEKVMPSAVTERKLPLHSGNDKSYKTLHYDSMTAILVEAIKELTAKVEKLEKR